MNVVFRVDASIQIGIGHVMRCLSLADQIQKLPSNIYFISRALDGHLCGLITKKGYKVILLPSLERDFTSTENNSDYIKWLGLSWCQDANETIEVIKNDNLDWLIVDHYCFDYRWHSKLKKFSKKLMIIDDLANRKLNCDLLLDQTYGRIPNDYIELVNVNTELLLGAEYALLRSEFSLSRLEALKKRKESNSIDNILVSVGGMDFKNFTKTIVDNLLLVKWNKKIVINIVLSDLAPNLESVKSLTQSSYYKFEINLFINADNIAELMVEADLAIGSSGSTSWERCTLGLPALVICTAENQKLIAENLQKKGVHLVVDISESEKIPLLVTKINEFQRNHDILKNMSDAAFNICSGKGASFLTLKMSPYTTKNGIKIDIRSATIDDAKSIYEWQCDPKTRKYAINSEIPSWSEHVKWVDKKINSFLSFFWIIIHDGSPSGVLRLDPKNLGEGDGYLISIFVDPDKYNLGIGKGAIEITKRIFSDSKLYAKVLSNNNNSISMFTNANFKFREDLTYFEWK
jgi:UDP-2,4-diacetamido-2,4,6-trideoxy-beta-L-altropyranose hydrolase